MWRLAASQRLTPKAPRCRASWRTATRVGAHRGTPWSWLRLGVPGLSEAVRALREAARRLRESCESERGVCRDLECLPCNLAKDLALEAQGLLSDERPWPAELAPPKVLPLGAA